MGGDGVKLDVPLRFPGQLFDAHSQMHYNYFRDYDQNRGRYVQSDPIGLEGGLNTYGYGGGNPLNYYDEFGLEPSGERGRTGGSSGNGTNNKYKHCRINPQNPNEIICKDQNGKKVFKPKPSDWEEYKNEICDGCEAVPVEPALWYAQMAIVGKY